MTTLSAWASFLTAPDGPRIHTDPRPFRAKWISLSWPSSALQPLSFAMVFLISSLVAEMPILITLASAARKGVATRTLLRSRIRVSRAANSAAFSLFWSSEISRITHPVIDLRTHITLVPTLARGTLSLAAVNSSA